MNKAFVKSSFIIKQKQEKKIHQRQKQQTIVLSHSVKYILIFILFI